MKKQIREMIKKLEMELTRRDGEWAIAIHPNNAPNKEEVKFIKMNRSEIITELRAIESEMLERERIEKENKPIKVELEQVGEFPAYQERYIAKENEEMVENLGLGKRIGYWGVVVDREIIEALGTEFTVEQAKDYMANKKELKETERKEKLEKLRREAEEAGDKIEIDRKIVDCDGSKEECDIDAIVTYIDGSGEITQKRIHMH